LLLLVLLMLVELVLGIVMRRETVSK